MVNDRFDRSKLSYRENEILELAIDGLTDQQIAHRLDISASTVNSYWVRIRGKLGHMSRTELVSMVLRHEAQIEVDRLTRQTVELERRVGLSEGTFENVTYRQVLDAIPEPILALSNCGTIVYANDVLAELFGFETDELIGQPGTKIIPEWNQSLGKLEDIEPDLGERGGRSVVFGWRKDGTEFKIFVSIGSTTEAPCLRILVVRGFTNEVAQMRAFTKSFAG